MMKWTMIVYSVRTVFQSVAASFKSRSRNVHIFPNLANSNLKLSNEPVPHK